jgi:hypothetical protein
MAAFGLGAEVRSPLAPNRLRCSYRSNRGEPAVRLLLWQPQAEKDPGLDRGSAEQVDQDFSTLAGLADRALKDHAPENGHHFMHLLGRDVPVQRDWGIV